MLVLVTLEASRGLTHSTLVMLAVLLLLPAAGQEPPPLVELSPLLMASPGILAQALPPLHPALQLPPAVQRQAVQHLDQAQVPAAVAPAVAAPPAQELGRSTWADDMMWVMWITWADGSAHSTYVVLTEGGLCDVNSSLFCVRLAAMRLVHVLDSVIAMCT